MSFLSQQNAQYITEVLYNFLKDKHNIKLFEVTTEAIYKQMLSNAMIQTNQNYGKQFNELELTKLVIKKLKEVIIEMAYNVNTTEPVSQTLQDKEASETEFINKLQQLEFQRQNINLSSPPPASINDLKPAEMVYNHPQSMTYPIPPVPPQQNTTVYMPSPHKIGTEVTISSWQRDWINYPERNGFIWKGPLPSSLDRTHVKLGCLIVPLSKKQCPPILSILIEGPNEHDFHIKVILESVFDTYSIYKPVTEGLSYLYLLALPWKINLETIDGESLYLGKDAIPYTILSTDSNKMTTIRVQDTQQFRVFDNIRIFTNKVILPSMILSIDETTMMIHGTFQQDGYILLFDKQFTLILETHSTVSKN